MKIPQKGLPASEVLKRLKQKKTADGPWEEGRLFGHVFLAGEEARQLVEQANILFLTENGLDPTIFKSLLELEREVISMALHLLGGDEGSVGNFTSGGTESIMLALKTARDYMREKRPEITQAEVVLARTAHAAFFKACHYLDLKPVVVPVDEDTFKAIPEEMEKAITPQTILLVGSAPSYAHGVIDPIEEIAGLAKERDLLCHVDACMGGMYLPFLRKLGYELPLFDLSVPGVTSLSVDFHKLGYAAKGASAVLYNSSELRQYQLFACADWTGYVVVNNAVQSSKSGGPLAAAWAILQFLGEEGYLQRCGQIQEAVEKMVERINKMKGLRVLGRPESNLLAFASESPSFSVFELSEFMQQKGWHLQIQLSVDNSPASIHFTLIPPNLPHIDTFLNDLQESIHMLSAREEGPALSPGAMQEILSQIRKYGAASLDKLAPQIGMAEGGLPDMTLVNTLLDQLEPSLREVLLKRFMNELFQ
jgi:sphinganine-1-phosphate aldolase